MPEAQEQTRATPQALIDSADNVEQFFGHLAALLDAAGQEAQPNCTGQSATARRNAKATQRKHVRWLASRCGVRVDDPRGKELINKILG
jgi:type VI protein secretion system component VasK